MNQSFVEHLRTEETRKLLAVCISGKNAGKAVFTRIELSGKRVPVADLRGTWEAVAKAAKHEGLLFYDLRRSAVREWFAPAYRKLSA